MNVPAIAVSASKRDAGDGDVVDAQLSELLESVEADRADLHAAGLRSAAAGRGRRRGFGRIRWRRRKRASTPRPERARAERPTAAEPTRAAARSAPAAQPAEVPTLADPGLRELTYYLVAAVVLAVGLGVLLLVS
jgi:hypothetical protein